MKLKTLKKASETLRKLQKLLRTGAETLIRASVPTSCLCAMHISWFLKGVSLLCYKKRVTIYSKAFHCSRSISLFSYQKWFLKVKPAMFLKLFMFFETRLVNLVTAGNNQTMEKTAQLNPSGDGVDPPHSCKILRNVTSWNRLGAKGKPSTWLPPGRLVEHNQHPRGAVRNDGIKKNTN